jgi:uncharacterized protein
MEMAQTGDIALLASTTLLGELQSVLSRSKFAASLAKLQLTPEEISDQIKELALMVSLDDISAVSRDPNDDHILACAVAGQADYIVTGDLDLLSLETYQDIPIVTAREFSERLS